MFTFEIVRKTTDKTTLHTLHYTTQDKICFESAREITINTCSKELLNRLYRKNTQNEVYQNAKRTHSFKDGLAMLQECLQSDYQTRFQW